MTRGYSSKRQRKKTEARRASEQGFSIIELLLAMAIIGILTSLTLPAYQEYTVRAKVTEGLVLLSERKATIAEYFSTHGHLPQTFEDIGFPSAGGQAHGGDAARFESVYGFVSDIWSRVEFQPKHGGEHMILVLRSHRKPRWNNADIGLHLQIKASDDAVEFRCVVNNHVSRQRWVPAVCRNGSVNEWNW